MRCWRVSHPRLSLLSRTAFFLSVVSDMPKRYARPYIPCLFGIYWYIPVQVSMKTCTGIYRYIPQCTKSSSLVQVVGIPDGLPDPSRCPLVAARLKVRAHPIWSIPRLARAGHLPGPPASVPALGPAASPSRNRSPRPSPRAEPSPASAPIMPKPRHRLSPGKVHAPTHAAPTQGDRRSARAQSRPVP